MGAFSNIKKSRATGAARTYIKEGAGVLRLQKAGFGNTRKRVEFFAAEFAVVETDSEERDQRPGSIVNYYTQSTSEMYEGNIKALLCAVLSVQESDLDVLSDEEFDELMKQFTGADNAFRGSLVRYRAQERAIKKPTGDRTTFCAVDFEPYEE